MDSGTGRRLAPLRVLGEGVVELSSGVEGPTLGLVCNIHGDEPGGRTVARWLANEIELSRGVLRLFDANREAYFVRRRYVDRDMNRLFTDSVLASDAVSLELARAKYLLPFLLDCDYVLDLHSTSTPSGQPFVLSWPGSRLLADMVSVARTYGWQGIVDGTLVEFLSAREVPAIALEAGEHDDPYTEIVAKYVTAELLDGLDMCPQSITRTEPINSSRAVYQVLSKYAVRDPKSYRFTRHFGAFDALEPGEVIGIDDQGEYIAPQLPGLRILMPASISSIRTGRNPDAFFLIKAID